MKLSKILEMEAGPDLNWLVHRVVFDKTMSMVISKDDIPDYSRGIAAAWLVVEKIMSMGYRYAMRGNFDGDGLHWAAFDHQAWADANPLFQSPMCHSLPLAICYAALIAILKEKG